MENPVEEVTGVVEQLCTPVTPDEQKAAVEKLVRLLPYRECGGLTQ
jgi:hypothetical protein